MDRFKRYIGEQIILGMIIALIATAVFLISELFKP